MASVVSVGYGASSVLFGEESVFSLLCKGDVTERAGADVYVAEVEPGGSGQMSVLSFLHAVPKSVRLSLWSRLSNRPTAFEFVQQVVLMGLRDRVDSSLEYYPTSRGEILVARGAAVRGLRFDEFYDRVVSREVAFSIFRMPSLVTSLPDGYCYLSSVVGGPPPLLAAIFEEYPDYAAVSAFMKCATRVDIVGDVAHVSDDGASLLQEVGRPGLRLGGPVCHNQDATPEVSVCGACQGSYPLVGVDAVAAALRPGDGELPTMLAVLRSPGATDIDVACMVEAASLASENEPGGPGGVDRLGLVAVRDGMVVTPPMRWVVWLDTGESLSAGDFLFQPRTFTGGLLAGFGECTFEYRGSRSALACRGFSPGAWLKFQHTLRLGVGGSIRDKIRGAAILGCAWLLVPGSGARGASKLWGVGNHPSDLLPGHSAQVGGMAGDIACTLSAGSKRALDVGRTPILVEYEGVCRVGGYFQAGTRGAFIVWSHYSSQVDFLVGADARARVIMRPYAERRMVNSQGTMFGVSRRRRRKVAPGGGAQMRAY